MAQPGRIGSVPRGTAGAKCSALNFFDKFQTSRDNSTYEKLSNEDVEGEMLKVLLIDFGNWLLSSPDVRDDEGNFTLLTSTTGNYFANTKEKLKAKFHYHDDWKTEDKWFPQLRAQLEDEHKRTCLEGGGGTDRFCMPLLKKQYSINGSQHS